MKFLKVFLNSVLNGLFFSGLIALLTLDININLPFQALAFGRLVLALAFPYGLSVVLASIILFFIVQFFAGRKFSIRLVSPSFLALSFAFIILVFLFILWSNLACFHSLFNGQARSLLRIQMIWLAALAVLAVAAVYASRRVKNVRLPFAGFFLIFIMGLTAAVAQRAKFPVPSRAGAPLGSLEAKKLDKNIILIGLEGLSFDFIIPLTQEGKLPNFSWLVDNGSWGRLETLAPSEAFLINRSLMTGKFPFKHGQLSLTSYELFFGTYRLEVTPRYIFFQQLAKLGLMKSWPNHFDPVVKDIRQIIEANDSVALNIDRPSRISWNKPDPKAEKAFNFFFNEGFSTRDRFLNIVRESFYSDWKNEEAAFGEKIRKQPDFYHLLLDGLNTVESYFFKFSFPEMFGSIAQEDLNRYGAVIANYYKYYDQMIGKYLAALKDNEILVVYSPYGIEPLPLWKRFVEWIFGDSDVSAYHEDKPDGAILIYGKGIAKGNTIEGMSIVDLAPTLLYYLGLPVGRDMDGIVKSSVFLPDYTAENPILSISSYEEIEIRKEP